MSNRPGKEKRMLHSMRWTEAEWARAETLAAGYAVSVSELVRWLVSEAYEQKYGGGHV